MTIRDLIVELLRAEAEYGGEYGGDEEVTIEMFIPPDTTWTGCLIDEVGEDGDGNLAIRAVAP